MLHYYDLTTIQCIQISLMNALVDLEHNNIQSALKFIADAQNLLTNFHLDEEHEEQIEKLLLRIRELEKRIPDYEKELPFS